MKTTFEAVIDNLAAATGAEIRIGTDRVAEIAVGDELVLAKPTDTGEENATIFAVVSEGELDEAALKRALSLNLFGRGTLGGAIGLFVDTLVYSMNVRLEGLSAEDFAEKLVAFAKKATEIAADISSGSPDFRLIHPPAAASFFFKNRLYQISFSPDIMYSVEKAPGVFRLFFPSSFSSSFSEKEISSSMVYCMCSKES